MQSIFHLSQSVLLLHCFALPNRLLLDEIRTSLRNHDNRSHGVRAGHARENASVGDAQVAYSVHAEALVDHTRPGLIGHAARAGRV